MGLAKQLHELAWKQWDHRNTVKHRTLRPRHKLELANLHREVTREYIKGAQDLPPGDRHNFKHNLVHLLQKSYHYKVSWLANVVAARQRLERIKKKDDELLIATKEQSAVFQYAKTRRAS